VIVTDPSGEKNWLEHEVVAEARNRCALPISHLVVTTDEHAVVIPSGPGDGRAVERHRHPTPPFS
jgi:hypothetical protein